jgi:hypothetical protein
MLKVPAPALDAPKLALDAMPDPPVQLPVMFKVPAPALYAPGLVTPDPPVQLPVMFKVPVDVLFAATLIPAVAFPPWQLPTKVAEFPEVPANRTHELVTALPEKALAVRVILFSKVNEPPPVAPSVVSFLTAPVAPRSVSTLTVMANEFAMRTSPAANVTAEAVPLGVVAQTSVASMFPAFRA